MKLILTLLDRLLSVCVVFPPVYIAYRFVRWYLRQGQANEDI